MNLREDIKQCIVDLAEKFNLNKVILFGSRARGDNRERSDIDLAIEGKRTDCIEFSLAADEDIPTLLMFDFVIIDEHLSPDLRTEIEKDGIILYEKV
ncbi:MAG: nucleotidyltransferase domain-containing protein [Selenomonadaceae bacterium]|nr:nucleotidyltransferase domain-containing protein [Selenomonadaceae bacterium]